ncbi:carbohydrate ABC transporter permease [Streptomyces sp. WMMB 322]|uniref:carbohydrate ABC transporter permease n=1 Tax=Streptomyces sp. WMMB 322 TaxID=1286821 RepID=UPI0008237A90|nr:sugar ABC transporter permease [Streptomyces sp. WMMB 322]SCK18675.1 carbohydrate ABC transporter membrane protein 1, CUT1 family (TC 3.A.1.1.-) [Streptomyces sp. WMMB 322]
MATTLLKRRRGAGRPRGAVASLLAPSTLFMLALFVWPLIVGIGQAVHGPDGFTLDNLRTMTGDSQFWPSVRNTVLLITVVIPLQFAFAISMALMLRARPRFSQLWFYTWVIPLAISDLAAGLVWLSIFSDRGYLNSVLHDLGLPTYSWLSYQHPLTVFLCILVAEVWRATSLVLVIVVAGMQGIPRDYEEAAEVFGASYWQRLRHVLLPQLRPSLQVALILRTILAFQTFAVAQALTGDNFPLLVGETYHWYTSLQNADVAAAIALVVLAMSMVTAVVYLRALRDRTPGGSAR